MRPESIISLPRLSQKLIIVCNPPRRGYIFSNTSGVAHILPTIYNLVDLLICCYNYTDQKVLNPEWVILGLSG